MYSNTIQYTKAYHGILFDTNINPTEYRVYMALSAFDINGNGIIDNICYRKLGELIGLSESRTRQVISSLVEKGYVVKHNVNIGVNNTRNKYILPKKIEQDILFKLSTKNDIPLPKSEILSTVTSDNSLPNYSSDVTDDDINNTIEILKQEEGEEVVSRALEKMEKYSISKKGFISYLKMTIKTIKNQIKKIITKNGTRTYNKNKSIFNNYTQRIYDWKKLENMLLHREEHSDDYILGLSYT